MLTFAFMHHPSLVPRPRGRREKWPGIHCLRMRENPMIDQNAGQDGGLLSF